MKPGYFCGCTGIRSLCRFMLNRRKWLQERRRLRLLQRLERLTAVD